MFEASKQGPTLWTPLLEDANLSIAGKSNRTPADSGHDVALYIKVKSPTPCLVLIQDFHIQSFAEDFKTNKHRCSTNITLTMLPRSFFAIVPLLRFCVQATNRAVNEWTAMGDSYASGVGAGEQPVDDTNRCFRFPNAYPAILQAGDGSLQPNPKKWNNVACSGNTATQILDKEFLDEPEDDGNNGIRPAWGDKPEFVTLTMGGNDIGILNLILTCVLSFKLWGKDCEEVIQEGTDIVQSDQLQTNFKAVIKKAYTRGRETPVGVEFQVFVTGKSLQIPECNYGEAAALEALAL